MRRKKHLRVSFGSFTLRLQVFPTLADLHKALVADGEPYNPDVLAATDAPIKGRKHMAVWFAADHLTLNVIVHESVHVAYAIGRWGVNPWQDRFEAEEEERIAYPSGEVATGIYRALVEGGWRPVA